VLNRVGKATYEEAIQQLGVRIGHCPPEVNSIHKRVMWLTQALRRIRPHVVHSWAFYTNVYAAICGRLAGVPARIGSLRAQPDFEIKRLPTLYSWLSFRAVDHLIVNSRQALETVYTRGYKHTNHVHLVQNGVEPPATRTDSAVEYLARWGIRDEHRVIASVGNLTPNKNHRMLIEGIQQLRAADRAKGTDQYGLVRGVIVGQQNDSYPGLHQALHQYIQEVGLSDVIHLTGYCDDVPQLMKRLTVFTLHSYSEGTPNVLLEAMAAGTPCIATCVGDVPHIVQHGLNGLLYEPGNTAEFHSQLAQVLNNADIAEQLGAAGQTTIEQHYSCVSMARKIEGLYEALARPVSEVQH
jgi:glycosyltransferase involved in cell wall biosynthesis